MSAHVSIPLFDRIAWRDPVSGAPLEPIVLARTPAGVPVCGALRVKGTSTGYPIVDCVARLTPESANRHRRWLDDLGLQPPAAGDFQSEATVESFGWQWTWNSNMRNDDDLKMRVADRFGISVDDFRGRVTLDAGAGAGDQSAYMLRHGADVVSIDLSSAIDVVARKLRMISNWVGVQGDITALPFESDQFDVVYCEGVIQHTRDSVATVRELCRVAKPAALVLACHYTLAPPLGALRRFVRKARLAYYEFLRSRLSRMERFKLLFLCGTFAALAYVPLLGRFIRWSGTALHYDLMPDFKTTWTNTYDYYGQHAYQRFLVPEEFWSYFERADGVETLRRGIGWVVAEKLRSPQTR
jgi:ubiquinone/menaquinone biosynthesis C-methylase UbiE